MTQFLHDLAAEVISYIFPSLCSGNTSLLPSLPIKYAHTCIMVSALDDPLSGALSPWYCMATSFRSLLKCYLNFPNNSL